MSKKSTITISKLIAILQDLQKQSGSPPKEKEQWTIEPIYGRLIVRSALGTYVGDINIKYGEFIPIPITMYEGKEI